ncbi:MAG: hypothetical protein HY318_09275 [Armatimonadetes bacterium]|nr:hypothetical protein [Armatimonadota bacterium]
MNETLTPKGPWLHRVAVVVFSILTGVLFFWLQSFVVEDIGNLKGPVYWKVEKRHLTPALVRQSKELDKKIVITNRRIADQKSRQELLRDSTSGSQRTMNQLLEMQRLSLRRNVKPSEAERKALAEGEALFLANQSRYQKLNEDIAKLSEEERGLEANKRGIESRLDKQRKEARKEFRVLLRKHHLKVAFLQLLFLVPMLLIAGYSFLKKRSSLYAPIIYAFGVATLVMVTAVLHEHFPARYFRYILLVASLAVVVKTLVYLIRAITFPKIESLIKQYREAYECFFCPVCAYPIRRGPLKYRFWDRRSLRRLLFPESSSPSAEEPYVCPACGTGLYEKCSSCNAVRHALLPFCEQCGAGKDLTARGGPA